MVNKFYAVLLLSVSLCITPGLTVAQASDLRFVGLCSIGADSSKENAEIKQDWLTFIRMISSKIDMPIKLVCASSLDEVSKMMLDDNASFGYVPQMQFELLASHPQFQPFASAVEHNGGSIYNAVFLANKSDQVAISALSNVPIGLVKGSASGEYLPKIALQKRHAYIPENIHVYSSYTAGLKALKNKEIRLLAFPESLYAELPQSVKMGDAFVIAYRMKPALHSPLLVANIQEIDPNVLSKLKDAVVDKEVNLVALHHFVPCSSSQCVSLAELSKQIYAEAEIEAV